MLRGMCVAPFHERADRGRRGVEHRHPVTFADVPEAVLVRPVRRALVDHDGCTERQRPIDDVGVSGHPADVRRAPEHVVVLEVEHDLRGVRHAREIAAGRVDDPLRFARRARRIEDVQHVLGIHGFGLARG